MPEGNRQPLEIAQPLIARAPHLYYYDPTYSLTPDIEAEYFAYPFPEFGPLTVGLTQQQQVIIQANTAFEMREIVYHWSLANAAFTESARPVPNVTLQLQDSGSSKNLYLNPAPLTAVATYGESRRRALNWPRIFSPNSTITAVITNFDAAQATGRLRLVMLGRHLYRLAR